MSALIFGSKFVGRGGRRDLVKARGRRRERARKREREPGPVLSVMLMGHWGPRRVAASPRKFGPQRAYQHTHGRLSGRPKAATCPKAAEWSRSPSC